MAARVQVDMSEVDRLAADVRQVPGKMLEEGTKSLHRGANNIKRQMQADARGSRHFKIAEAIGYDVDTSGSAIEATIGPALGGAGSLMHIAVHGGRHGGGGTLADPEHALAAEAPNFEAALGAIAERLL